MYALRYEVFDDLVSFADVADQTPGRNLWPLKSPVALFAIKTQKNGKRLRPVAIQLDYKPGRINSGHFFVPSTFMNYTIYTVCR